MVALKVTIEKKMWFSWFDLVVLCCVVLFVWLGCVVLFDWVVLFWFGVVWLFGWRVSVGLI